MPFIATKHPNDAVGDLRAMYLRQQKRFGYVPSYAQVFGARPEIMALWADLLSGLKRNLDPRLFELSTLAAARALGSSYCSLAHGMVLTRFYSPDEVRSIFEDPESPVLTAGERAMMRYAAKVVTASSEITAADTDTLEAHGFSDEEIFDIAAAAAGRAFFANLCEALGAQADKPFLEMNRGLRETLTVGRPINTAEPARIDSVEATKEQASETLRPGSDGERPPRIGATP